MDIAQILRSEGFKVTPQRIAIYDALRGHHNHPTAEMIYHSLRPTHPSMSLATVYKTMELAYYRVYGQCSLYGDCHRLWIL